MAAGRGEHRSGREDARTGQLVPLDPAGQLHDPGMRIAQADDGGDTGLDQGAAPPREAVDEPPEVGDPPEIADAGKAVGGGAAQMDVAVDEARQ